MKQKRTVLLFGVILIVLAVMCSGCSQRISQQEVIWLDTESAVWTTEQASCLEIIETESVPETEKTTEEAEGTETENAPSL